jgi:hypothetical protein
MSVGCKRVYNFCCNAQSLPIPIERSQLKNVYGMEYSSVWLEPIQLIICAMLNGNMKKKNLHRNRVICRLVSDKIQDRAGTHRWQNFNGKNFWTVNAKDLEW